MKPRMYAILRECIEAGAQAGLYKCEKREYLMLLSADSAEDGEGRSQIDRAVWEITEYIMSEIDAKFTFEDDLS